MERKINFGQTRIIIKKPVKEQKRAGLQERIEKNYEADYDF